MAAPKRAPLPPRTDSLGEFDGVPVSEVGTALRNAGDGWAEAIKIAPRIHQTGDEVFAVIRCVVGPVDHDPLNDEGKRCSADDIADGAVDSYRRTEDWLLRQLIEVDGSAVQSWLNESAAEVAKVKAEREEEARQAALVKAEADALAAEQEAGVMRLVPPSE
jgi:hypothetical protein